MLNCSCTVDRQAPLLPSWRRGRKFYSNTQSQKEDESTTKNNSDQYRIYIQLELKYLWGLSSSGPTRSPSLLSRKSGATPGHSPVPLWPIECSRCWV